MKNFGIREGQRYTNAAASPSRELSIVRAEWRSGPERDLAAGGSSFRDRSERGSPHPLKIAMPIMPTLRLAILFLRARSQEIITFPSVAPFE